VIKEFDRQVAKLSKPEYWAVAEELIASLEGVLMEREEASEEDAEI